jgi:hypothetical protein
MEKLLKLKIVSILTLIIPISIFVVGDFLGAGIQFPLFKIQITYMGSFIITIFRDLNYIMNGTLSGRTALSVLIWFLGIIILIIGIILIWNKCKENTKIIKITGILIIFSAILFLISTILQYGLFLNGPAGIAIPVGLPVIFVIGGWIFYEGCHESLKKIEVESSGE